MSSNSTNMKELGISKLIQALEKRLNQIKENEKWVELIVKEQSTSHLSNVKEIVMSKEKKLLSSMLNNISELSKFLEDIVLIQNLFDRDYAELKTDQKKARVEYLKSISKYENVSPMPTSDLSKLSDLLAAMSVYLGPFKNFVDAVTSECKKEGICIIEQETSSKHFDAAFYEVFYVHKGDYKRITDVLTSSFVFDNFAQLYKTYSIIERLAKESKFAIGGILCVKDNFEANTVTFGFRDMKIKCYAPDTKVVCEIQLHHAKFFSKKKLWHDINVRAQLFEDRETGVNLAYQYAEAFVRPKLGNDKVYEDNEEKEGSGHYTTTEGLEQPMFKQLLKQWELTEYIDNFEKDEWTDENDWDVFVGENDEYYSNVLKTLIVKKPHQLKFKRLLKAWLATKKENDSSNKEGLEGGVGKKVDKYQNYFVTQRQWRSFINCDTPMNKFGYKDEPADGSNKHWFNFQFVAFESKPTANEFQLKKIVLSDECGSGISFYAFNQPYPDLGITEEIVIMDPALVVPARFTAKGHNGLFFMRSDTSNFWGFRVKDTFWTKVTHSLIPNKQFFVTHNLTNKESFVQIGQPFVKKGFSNNATNNPLYYPFHFVAFPKNEKPLIGRGDELKQITIDDVSFWGFSKPLEDFVDQVLLFTNDQKKQWLIPNLVYQIYQKQISDNWTLKESFYTRVRSDLVPNTYFHVSHSDKRSSFVQMHHPCLENGFAHINKETENEHWQPFHWIAFDKKPPLLTNVQKVCCISDEGGVQFWAFNEKCGDEDMHEILIWEANNKRWVCGGEFVKNLDRNEKHREWTLGYNFWALSFHPKY